MTTPSVSTMTADTLARALLAGCTHHGSDWGEEAALRLLIAHGVWLHRSEFRDHVDTATGHSHGTIAWARWSAMAAVADRSPASTSELAVLRLACHLAGYIPTTDIDQLHRWALAEILSPLDSTNGLLASRAVAIAVLGPDTVGPLE